MSYLLDIETAFPKNYYEQDELISSLKKLWEKKFFNPDRIEQFHRNVLVGGRHLALPLERYSELKSFEEKNNAWIEVAGDLAYEATKNLLEKFDLQASEISLIASTTVTGIAVPSLEARLMNRLPFKPSTKRMPLFGLGCLAGAAGLNRVFDYLEGHPTEAALFISVELCSLTLQPDDFSVANLVSTGLFGDGGAAVLMVGRDHPLAGRAKLKWRGGVSRFFPNSERVMGWDVVDTGFKIVLNKDVPDITLRELPGMTEDFLSGFHATKSDLNFFMAHPGGPKVLEAMESALGLSKGALEVSWDSLKRYGNMSSTSVLFITKETIKSPRARSSLGLMAAMGPAFCAELGLYEWVGSEL